jgi:hypothetical protein
MSDEMRRGSDSGAARIGWSCVRGTEGFFRVGRTEEGVWWLIDPRGRPLFYKGVCAINRAGTPRGRYATPGPYHDTIGRLYGEDAGAFAEACFDKMRYLGFNAVGAWATREFFDRGMPWTEILECCMDSSPYPLVEPSIHMKGEGVNLPDVFDPVWERSIERLAERFCAPYRDSTELVGYFTDNEMGWGQRETEHIWGAGEEMNRTEGAPTLLQFCLCVPGRRPAREAAWRFVLERHGGSLADVSRAWGVALNSTEKLAELTDGGLVLDTASYGADHEEFSYRFACAYFEKTRDAIRRHDPNHLILGCRFGAPPGTAVLRACTPERLDIISANNYRDTFYERVDAYHEPTAMPVLNGEFAWASGYFTMPRDEEPADVSVEERIRRRGPAALKRAAAHPALVGYTWYRWVSNHEPHAPTYGLVNYDDVLNTFHAPLLREVNGELEELHRAAGRGGARE